MKQQIIKFLKYILPWVVTILSLFFIIKAINFKELLVAFSQVDFLILLLAILNSMIFTLYICVYKYKAVLKFLGYNIPFKDVQAIKLGALPMKTFIPFKVGEFIRAIYLNRNYNIPYRQGIYSIILGYLLRAIILGIFVIASCIIQDLHLWPPVAIISIILVTVLFKDFQLIFYSVLFELCLLINYFIVFKAAKVYIPLNDFFIYVPIILFLESLPVSVYGFGIREGLCVVFLGKNAGMEKALLCGLTSSFMNSIMPMIISLFFILPFVTKLIQEKSEVRSQETDHVLSTVE